MTSCLFYVGLSKILFQSGAHFGPKHKRVHVVIGKFCPLFLLKEWVYDPFVAAEGLQDLDQYSVSGQQSKAV